MLNPAIGERVMKSEHIVIVGAGIVGAASAIWLRRAGKEVTLIDKGEPGMIYSQNGIRYEFINGELTPVEKQLELGFELVEDSNPRFHLASGAGYEEFHPETKEAKDAALARHKKGQNT